MSDQYGNSVNSEIATLTQSGTLANTNQPRRVTADFVETVQVTVNAVGDGLTYQWFYKNAGSSSFIYSSRTTSTYTITMTADCVGRQIFCMVSDKYGNSVITNIVTLNKG